MSNEEKARAYDEALAKARAGKTLEEIFPKMNESEDETHRKWILEYLYDGLRKSDEQFKEQFKAAIAYLEKQKEIPLMNGDADLYFDNWIQHNDTTKRGCFEEGIRYAQRLQKEQNSVEYIKRNSKEWYALLSEQYDKGFWKGKAEQKPVERSLEDDHIIGFVYDLLNEIEWKDNWAMSKEECLRLLNNYSPQKPAEWSEEDEKMLDEVLDRVTYAFYNQGLDGEIEDDPAFLWLHRLRPSWKPSEEQMDRLFSIETALREDYCYHMADFLANLYADLKKLI